MKKSKLDSDAPSSTDADRPASATPDTDTKPGHDARGRFTAGNAGGPGNPFGRRVAELRTVFLEAVTREDLQSIVAKVVEKAKEGDLAAAKLLLQYTIGKPAETVDPDTLDVQELELYQRAPAPGALHELLAARLPTELACNLMRLTLPCVTASLADAVSAELLKPADPEEAEVADMDDDEVFARLQAAERAKEAARHQAARPHQNEDHCGPATPAPSPNGDSRPARPEGNGSTANGKHDPSTNGTTNGQTDDPGTRKRYPFGL